MELVYKDTFTVSDLQCDRYGRLKPSAVCWFVQEIAGRHCQLLGTDWDTLAEKNMFWAILRHGVQIQRLPHTGENITVETWPMPTTRVAFPRHVVAYDEAGNELFRSISIWVLMNTVTRAMILPGKSGVDVPGLLQGGELEMPASIPPAELTEGQSRQVRFTDLDINGHMNNCRYLDWAWDLLPSSFHKDRTLRTFTLGYLSEAREEEILLQQLQTEEDGTVKLEISRPEGDKNARIFCARFVYT